MSFARYIRTHTVSLTVIALSLCGWCVLAAFMRLPWLFILLTAAVVVLGAAVYVCISYTAFRKRMARIRRLQGEMEEVYLMGEVLPRPVNAVEEEYFAVMKAVSGAAVGRVFELRRELDEYLDYVESWVHEIKTPLTACTLILSGDGDVRRLKTELRRADNLAESVLFYARLRTAGTISAGKFSVADAVKEAIRNEMELLISSRVCVETEGDFSVTTDRQTVVFSLKQLLVNCAKYCRGGHVKITAAEGRLTVEDDGEGIASHELPLVFTRGFVGNAGRVHGGGTGMGLYIVKHLCEKCGIDVTVTSEKGKFTRFTFVFPESEKYDLRLPETV